MINLPELFQIIEQLKADLNELGVIDTINIIDSTDEDSSILMEITFTQACYAQTLHNRIIKADDLQSLLDEKSMTYLIDPDCIGNNTFILNYVKKTAKKMKKALIEKKNSQELSAFLIPFTKMLTDLDILVRTNFLHLHRERNEQQEQCINLSIQLTSKQATQTIANMLLDEDASKVAYDLEEYIVQYSYNLTDVQKNQFAQNFISSSEAEKQLIQDVLRNTLQNAALPLELTSQRASRKFESPFTLFRKIAFYHDNAFQEHPLPLSLPNIDNLYQLMHRAQWIKNTHIDNAVDEKIAVTLEFSAKTHAQALCKTMQMPVFNRFFPADSIIDLSIDGDIPHITYYCTPDDKAHVLYQDLPNERAIDDFEEALMDNFKLIIKPAVIPPVPSPASVTESITKVSSTMFSVPVSNNSSPAIISDQSYCYDSHALFK